MINQLKRWMRREYRLRTEALARGEGRIEWLDPATRVSFSEATAQAEKLGLKMDVVALRLALQGWKKS